VEYVDTHTWSNSFYVLFLIVTLTKLQNDSSMQRQKFVMVIHMHYVGKSIRRWGSEVQNDATLSCQKLSNLPLGRSRPSSMVQVKTDLNSPIVALIRPMDLPGKLLIQGSVMVLLYQPQVVLPLDSYGPFSMEPRSITSLALKRGRYLR